jgi:C1A family cysteine protease
LFVAVLVCACFFGTVLAARELSDDLAMAARHEQWMVQFGRVYNDAAEKERRFEMFKANVKFIESFDAEKRKFWLGVNQFADLSNDEFRATKTNKGFKPSTVKVPTGFRYENISIDTLPESVDWKTKGAVTPIKDDQGQCGNVYLRYITQHTYF